MSNPRRPPMSIHSSTDTDTDRDPLSDSQPHTQFQERPVPQHGMPQQSESNTSFPLEFAGGCPSDEPNEQDRLLVSSAGDYGSVGGQNQPGPQIVIHIYAPEFWFTRQKIEHGVPGPVKLTQGNFIREHCVPTDMLSRIEAKWKDLKNTTEFSHMRYTAATCDPDEFSEDNGYTLRAKMYNRSTELLIAITSYNEDKTLYARTLHGVMLNIRDICNSRAHEFWRRGPEGGEPAWHNICVALIVDGLDEMDKSVLDLLATVGVYQDGVMKKEIDGREVVGHIFEYTTQLSVDDTPKVIHPLDNDPETNNLVPAQIIFVLKAKNQKKINSHRWLFQAIGKMLEPKICVLIDAGTKPGNMSIFQLWEAFRNDPHLGGACGEIHAMIKGGKKLLNPLVAAQNFEYKMSNILDKTFESSFGYVSVLPGAFSAYRYRAIEGRPLEQYFRGDHSLTKRLGAKGIQGMNIFTKNMYLAEDRILCFELVAKAGDQWTLTYVKASKAETDVPESTAELIGQRRRWLNGSFAASVYALVHLFRFYKSGHGITRKFFFHIQALYNLFSLIFSWFALANLWLTFSIIIELLPNLPTDPIFIFGTAEATHWVNESAKWLYLSFLALQFVLALGNRPKGERVPYAITLWVYAILSLYLMVCAFWLTGHAFADIPNQLKDKSAGEVFVNLIKPPVGALIAAMISTFGIYLFASLLSGDPWHMFSSFPQYILLAPSFTNVLNVYAFCNLHDVSWGTKGSASATALPSVTSENGKEVVTDNTSSAEGLNTAYKEAELRVVEEVVVKPATDDQNKTFRTRLVGAWMLSNAALSVAIQNLNDISSGDEGTDQRNLQSKQHFYFAIVLYSTFGLALVRFMGCLFYFFKRNWFRLCRRS